MDNEIKKLTWEEVVAKYGECKVKFNSYYKYQFTFEGVFEDLVILVRDGGDSSDIYRYDVTADREETVKEFQPNCFTVIKDEKVIEEYYDNY